MLAKNVQAVRLVSLRYNGGFVNSCHDGHGDDKLFVERSDRRYKVLVPYARITFTIDDFTTLESF